MSIHVCQRMTKFTTKKKKKKTVLPQGASQLVLVVRKCGRPKRFRLDLWVWKILWKRAWQPNPVFLPGKSNGQKSLVGYSPQGCKELDLTKMTQHACTHVALEEHGLSGKRHAGNFQDNVMLPILLGIWINK